jgi:nucleoside permease NupC
LIGSIAFGLFGLATLIGIAWLASLERRAVDWRLVITGVSLQIAFAAVVLLVPGGKDVFDWLGKGFVKVLGYVQAGSGFIFGGLMDTSKFGFIFAFQVLPTIIFFASLMAVLYHLNVMQTVVRGMAWAITKVMRVSGAETTSVCASVFIGQTEAPAHDPALHLAHDAVGAAHDHDRRHGAHRGRRARGIRADAGRLRSRAAGVLREAPAGPRASWPRPPRS